MKGNPQQPTSSSGASSSQATSSSGSQGGQGAVTRRSSGGLSPYSSSGMPSLFGGGGPFELLRRLDEDMDRLFDEFWGGGGRRAMRAGQAPTLWMPQVEMCEQGGKFHVYADLPGLKKDDVKVSIEGDVITLQGERRASQEEGQREQGGYWRSERSYGSFYRTIALPEGVDPQTAEASFKDGVLDVCFDAPRQSRNARQLEIREGDASQSAPSSGARGGTSGSTGTA